MRRVALSLALVLALAAPATALSEADPNQDGRRHTRADRKAYEILTRAPSEWACASGCSAADRTKDRKDAIRAGRLIAMRRWNWTAENGQWPCVYRLWSSESGWFWKADNPTSSAYGIPQFTGSKGATHEFRTDPLHQIRRGYQYIEENYGQPTGTGCDPGY